MKRIDRFVKKNYRSEEAILVSHNGKPTLIERFKLFWIRSYYETKLSIKSESRKQFWMDMLFMFLGNLVLAFGTQIFILDNGLITGGVSGISLILETILKNTNISVNILITILTWVLFFLGLLLLGLRFAFKTLMATIIFPPLLFLFQLLQSKVPFLCLGEDQLSQILGAVFGGALVGVGCGLTFIGGGSTGGVDCLSLAANKYLHIKTSVAAFLVDSIVIIIGFIVNKNLEFCLLGIASALVAAFMIDRVFLGQSSSFICYIVSPRYQQISDRINYELERGTTLLMVEGGYTHNDYKMVEVVFDRKEYREIQNIIADVDPKAFITTVRAHEVNGYGFRKLSAPKKQSLDDIIKLDKNTRFRKPPEDNEDGQAN